MHILRWFLLNQQSAIMQSTLAYLKLLCSIGLLLGDWPTFWDRWWLFLQAK